MYAFMFAYSSRTDEPIFPKLGMLMPWNHEGILERSKLRKSVLGSSPGKDVSVARKLSMMKQQCQDQFFLFRRVDYKNEGHESYLLSFE
jgi:hypothetical protein